MALYIFNTCNLQHFHLKYPKNVLNFERSKVYINMLMEKLIVKSVDVAEEQ